MIDLKDDDTCPEVEFKREYLFRAGDSDAVVECGCLNRHPFLAQIASVEALTRCAIHTMLVGIVVYLPPVLSGNAGSAEIGVSRASEKEMCYGRCL